MTNFLKKSQSNFDSALFGLTLDRRGSKPLYRQLIGALRALVVEMKDAPGLRLPASRTLAEELSISRMTVTLAYDQLVAEGYLNARRGVGTFVATHLPHGPQPKPPLFRSRPAAWLPFQLGAPDPGLFPHRLWARHLERAWRTPNPEILSKTDPFGWYPLREAICAHLSAWRGLQASPEQVIVTAGAWEAFDKIAETLFQPGQTMVIEDPGWTALHPRLLKAGLIPYPVRLDAQGLNLDAIPPEAAAIAVTPSRQYPTGVAMPLARRLALLDWAERTQSLILEDDYDSEFRYQGSPLPSLAGLDGLRRTLYIGNFSKLLSPALRIGYLAVPAPLIGVMAEVFSRNGAHASLIPQSPLALFMESGDFAVHLRRMRRTYVKRQARLIEALRGVGDLLELLPDPSGMHLCLPLKERLRAKTSDQAIAEDALGAGVVVRSLSSHARLPDPPQALLLGYAAFDSAILTDAAEKLGQVLRKHA